MEASESGIDLTSCSDSVCDTQASEGYYKRENPRVILSTPKIHERPQHGLHFETRVTNNVYLTDGIGAIPNVLVSEGDEFVGWKAGTIETVFHEYDDSSISYWSVLVEFKGEAEVRAYLKYNEGDLEMELSEYIYAAVFEESLNLMPNLPNRSGWVAFQVYPDETNSQLFDLFRGLEGGIIEDAIIIINNYRIVFAFTDVADTAKILKVMLEDKVVYNMP